MLDWTRIGILPVSDGGITKKYGVKNIDGSIHYGLDFGYVKEPYCDILAWQDGTVVQAESYKYGGERGEYCVIEHKYNDGTKRWTGYLHLLGNSLKVKVGDTVKLGQAIAKRGNTGKSNGTHLHLYLSNKVSQSVAYSYDNMKKACTINPVDYLYVDDSLNKTLASSVINLPKMPAKIIYPHPVERDVNKSQIEINHPNKWLRLRNAPAGEIYDQYCINGIYNIYEKQWKNNWLWCKIDTVNGNDFWVGYGETWAVIHEPTNYQQLYEKAIADLDACNKKITELEKKISDASEILK